MTTFLTLVNQLFDLIFFPFRSLNPIYGLLVVSVLTGILMVLIFRTTSNQAGIKQVKERIKAHLLAIRLFQDQLDVVLRTHARILGATLSYMGFSLRPLAVMFLPIVLIMVQLELRLGQHAAQPEESFLVAATFTEADGLEQASLQLPPGLALTAPPLRIFDRKEITWRVEAREAGDFTLGVVVGEKAFAKTVTVGDSAARLSSKRVRAGLVNQFLHPGEPPLSTEAPVESIEIKYRPRSIDSGLFESHWLIPFFGLSLIAGLALKGVLRTEI
jgi:hypothetical protein